MGILNSQTRPNGKVPLFRVTSNANSTHDFHSSMRFKASISTHFALPIPMMSFHPANC